MALITILTIYLVLVIKQNVSSFRCERRPYGTSSQSSPADGRFVLQLVDGEATYIPEQLYTLQIVATDSVSKFIGFMISAEGDMKPNPQNPRRLISLYPGTISSRDSSTAKASDRCLYSVEQVNSNYKDTVEVLWRAPPSGSGCVTLRAMVAENQNVWFEDGSPLTLKICEDTRQPDDIPVQLNNACEVCSEAKYEVCFTGIWSHATHPRYFPEYEWVPRYSDLVGASHTGDYILWSPGTKASEGLRILAAHANSSVLEKEILEKVGESTRTLIKGKGHGAKKMDLPTYAFFRTSKEHHLVSVAVAIFPSPDWFLGVARFELCQADNTWLVERELNLYPWDAGTDSGVSYESPKSPTFPQEPVVRVQMSSNDFNSPFYKTNIKDLHPFGRLRIKLIKTYPRECEETTGEESEGEDETNPTDEEGENEDSDSSEPENPSRYQNPDLDSTDYGGQESEEESEDNGDGDKIDEDNVVSDKVVEEKVTEPPPPENCRMSKWKKWSKCEGVCLEGTPSKGLRYRLREHLPANKTPSKYCQDNFETFEYEDCEFNCSGEEEKPNVNAERRVMTPILPGHSWSKKRHLNNVL